MPQPTPCHTSARGAGAWVLGAGVRVLEKGAGWGSAFGLAGGRRDR